MDVSDLVAQEVAQAKERAEEEKRAKHVRPWDRGKGKPTELMNARTVIAIKAIYS